MVSAIMTQTNFCFTVEKNVVPVEDILSMHNIDDTLTEEARYNTRIWCYYIACDLEINLENLNEVNNCLTWINYFTQGFHNMAKAGIFKMSNGKTVRKWISLFIVEKNPLLRK